MTPFWSHGKFEALAQGDLLPGCYLPLLPDDLGPTKSVAIDLEQSDLIVVTQSCDLANQKAGLVALCPIYTLPQFEQVNPHFAKKGVWEDVRKGRREGYHLLASPTNPGVGREALVVNFREIHSLPVGYLKRHAATLGERWRLQSPFLEHFSQAFARFFMRVGLPSAIPPFTD
jgi:hypothetical protein